MKAVVFEEYGSPDRLELREVHRPSPRENEALVRVRAASVNSWDWDLLRGKPLINRLLFGIRKPRIITLGCDIAGEVEAVGNGCEKYRPGDRVFGDISRCGWGGFAEYVCAKEEALTAKAAGMTFEEAAAIPQAGVMALQGLRDGRPVRPGQKVLLNGAGGGVGTFAIQMARSFGAEVTGVDRPEKLEMLRSLGAQHVIDFTREDFARSGEQYDLILDVVGNRSLFEYRRALTRTGAYRMIGGRSSLILQLLLLGPLLSRSGGRKLGILAHEPNKNVELIVEHFEAGTVKPVIDRSYELCDAAQALRRLGEGHVQGKIVVTM